MSSADYLANPLRDNGTRGYIMALSKITPPGEHPIKFSAQCIDTLYEHLGIQYPGTCKNEPAFGNGSTPIAL